MPQAVPEPHTSHEMTAWDHTIVTLVATARFGRIRHCRKCLAEQAETVCGAQSSPRLSRPCTEIEDED